MYGSCLNYFPSYFCSRTNHEQNRVDAKNVIFRWIPLQCRPGKTDGKYRGEVEVKVTFHCHSRTEFTVGGLKKRSSSIRDLASAVGMDKRSEEHILSLNVASV
jgi:hypothetical protein